MPALNPPDLTGPPPVSPLMKPKAPVSTQIGQQAYGVARTCLGPPPVPYFLGGNNPPPLGPGLDCSGLMVYAYTTGPGSPAYDLGGRTVAAFWNPTTSALTRVVDNTGSDAGITFEGLMKVLLVGDMLIFGPPGISGEQGHVCMYAGNGYIIEEPHKGDVCHQIPMYAPGPASPVDGFLGVMRPSVEGPGGTGDTSTQGSGSQSSQAATSADVSAQNATFMDALPDPRSNLPFSKYFQTMSFTPGNKLVRGGMADLSSKKFRLYFMMNPQQITMGSNIDTTNLTSPLQQDPTNMQYGGYFITNQTIGFTIYFNRMYEVWQGGVKGPSEIGCRWDIRALERLMGIFDAQADGGGGSATGVGNYGAGGYPPTTLPIQVVFGGANSYQFMGQIASLDWTYTLFDRNMVPVEAFADLSVMRIYLPDMASPPLTNSLPLTAAMGGQYLPSLQASQSTLPAAGKFNAKKGTVS